MQWIPGHRGVDSNELADYLDKQGTSILQTSRNAISFDNIKLLIKINFILNLYSEKNSNKIWWNRFQNIPKRSKCRAVAEFHLATGHVTTDIISCSFSK